MCANSVPAQLPYKVYGSKWLKILEDFQNKYFIYFLFYTIANKLFKLVPQLVCFFSNINTSKHAHVRKTWDFSYPFLRSNE